ncbi:oxidoreductase [Autumnicola musiva]|uniref:Oxidoreductase n=1 Tax=Autumnicola musiva TaxID=3075589 RepID=A0ABU3DAE4_9FLAO|nr:oxidoreductase [Zunongwangia sp. F117]MDT0677928.1 oxidoreductase [Zunongwangia sp. F117]
MMTKTDFTIDRNLSEKLIFITGANSGLGFETTKFFAEKKATVIMACRNMQKAQKAKNLILEEYPEAKLSVIELDLADMDSIRKCAAAFNKTYEKLDVLINNAGVMVPPYSKTKQGFELQFGTNFLGHFALTGLVMPALLKTENSRVVSLSSLASRIGKIDFEDLQSERKDYKKWPAYGQSKLADLIFSKELARRLENINSSSISVAAHPGGSPTNLQRSSSFLMKYILTPLISHPPEKAALPTIRAACDPTVENGSYWGPSGFFELTGKPEKAKIPLRAKDIDTAKRLWNEAKGLTGVTYPFGSGKE